MRRVFTFPLCGSAVFTGTDIVMHNAVASWLPEEDIVIIGWHSYCHYTGQSENDGYTYIAGTLSQAAAPSQPGDIDLSMISEGWNTSPAFGYVNNVNKTVMLPEDHGIPIPEGTPVMVHISGRGKSAGATEVCMDFILYYVKGKLSTLRRG